jgi:hypothetical protein
MLCVTPAPLIVWTSWPENDSKDCARLHVVVLIVTVCGVIQRSGHTCSVNTMQDACDSTLIACCHSKYLAEGPVPGTAGGDEHQ